MMGKGFASALLSRILDIYKNVKCIYYNFLVMLVRCLCFMLVLIDILKFYTPGLFNCVNVNGGFVG